MATLQFLRAAHGAERMTWLIYAVLPTPAPSLTLIGVDDTALSFVQHGNLCVAVSRHAGQPSPTIAATLAFGDAVMALWTHVDAIPMRFGMYLDSPHELDVWLNAEHDTFTARLRLVAGCAEVGVRFPLAAQDGGDRLQPGRGVGHAYLAARAQCASWRDELAAYRQAERLASELAGMSRRWRFDGLSNGFVGLDFLVPRAHVDDFAKACRRAAAERGDPLYVSGPWPPYSFSMPGMTSRQATSDSPLSIA